MTLQSKVVRWRRKESRSAGVDESSILPKRRVELELKANVSGRHVGSQGPSGGDADGA